MQLARPERPAQRERERQDLRAQRVPRAQLARPERPVQRERERQDLRAQRASREQPDQLERPVQREREQPDLREQPASREQPARPERPVPRAQLAQLARLALRGLREQPVRLEPLAQPAPRRRLPSAAYPREIRVRMPQ